MVRTEFVYGRGVSPLNNVVGKNICWVTSVLRDGSV
ncbi:TPA: endonuclease, partial [Enterobacter kobei]|nr:endonuclease [Enterobacter kobei]